MKVIVQIVNNHLFLLFISGIGMVLHVVEINFPVIVTEWIGTKRHHKMVVAIPDKSDENMI